VRKPDDIECLYLDFDGFFASVEQQAHPHLRGKPVGVVPFAGAERSSVIACSREAKARGVKNVMTIADARRICPDIILVPQTPDLYRRAHNMLLAEIESVLPIDAVKSIDELACRLDPHQRADPYGVARELKTRLARHVGPYITCSIGFAANRQLAKMACKVNKPDGVTLWHPRDMPGPLLARPISDVPGVGSHMRIRLLRAGVQTMEQLYQLAPKHMRKIWNNVTGERLWYALHGYDVQAPQSGRSMFGHARVLPPESRTMSSARAIARLLLIKAARRLRRGGFYCAGVAVFLSIRDDSWNGSRSLPPAHDDQALLEIFATIWDEAVAECPKGTTIFRVGITLYNLSSAQQRQLDMWIDDDVKRQRWERINAAMDQLNTRYGRTVASLGLWAPPKGGHVGGKISYTRIPSAEDFW